MSKVTDASILEDLEYRGMDDFLSEMESGLIVPTCFVDRVTAIVKENYGLDLVAKPGSYECQEGVFCLMPYNDTRVSLVSSY